MKNHTCSNSLTLFALVAGTVIGCGGGGTGSNVLPADVLFSTQKAIGAGADALTAPQYGGVNIPAGAFFGSTNVTFQATESDAADNLFLETTELFDIRAIQKHEMRIRIGTVLPKKALVANVSLPDQFLNRIANGDGIECFALCAEGGGEESVDRFRLVPGTLAANGKSIEVSLPAYAFSKKLSADGRYEAIIVVASTPGSHVNPASVGQASNDPGGCEAAGITEPLQLPNGEKLEDKISSPFGVRNDPVTGDSQMHWGTDFRVPVGTPIAATSDGYISRVKLDPKGFGLYMIVKHRDGSATLYGHLSAAEYRNMSVDTGDFGQDVFPVRNGETLGKTGNSGKSTGPHLHFEYSKNGVLFGGTKGNINPVPCITSGTVQGSITVGDNGPAADDVFDIAILSADPNNPFSIRFGETPKGARPFQLPIFNIRPGSYTLKITCTDDGDNGNDVGTLGVGLNNGITFSDGSAQRSAGLELNQTVLWDFNVPTTTSKARSTIAVVPKSTLKEKTIK